MKITASHCSPHTQKTFNYRKYITLSYTYLCFLCNIYTSYRFSVHHHILNTRYHGYFCVCSYGAKTDLLAPQMQKSECEKCTSPIQIHGKRNEIQSKLVKQGLAYSIRHTTNLISLYFVAGCTAKNRNSKVHLYL